MSFGVKSRKGQFFLVGAILIVLILHMLSTTLYRGTRVEFSVVQDNNPIWTVEETEKGLYEIARRNLTDASEIDEFIQMQKEIAKESGYVLWFDLEDFEPYSGVPADVNLYSVILKSKDFYIEKSDKLLIYYSDCRDIDDLSACDFMDAIISGYPQTCCKAYGFCC